MSDSSGEWPVLEPSDAWLVEPVARAMARNYGHDPDQNVVSAQHTYRIGPFPVICAPADGAFPIWQAFREPAEVAVAVMRREMCKQTEFANTGQPA